MPWRVLGAFVLGAAMLTSPAFGQALPASVRSAGVTEVQWTQAQGVIRSQAAALNLREDAVRTLAIEIFEGQPGLSFEQCLELIREGAQRLPQLVATARALNPRGDSALMALQARVMAAAEAGRLSEALALQNEYSARFRDALSRAVEQPQLDLAASYAAAGDYAYALGQHMTAASQYADAAAAAPESALDVRWDYRRRQADAVFQRGNLFAEPQSLAEAVRLYEQVVMPLAPRETRPVDWARTQVELGWVRIRQGNSGDNAALTAAASNFDDAAASYAAADDPLGRAEAQRGQGVVLVIRGERGESGAFESAVDVFERALAARRRELDRAGWALTQRSLGGAFLRLGEHGHVGALERSVAAYEAALTVMTREADPTGWALTQLGVGLALMRLGERGQAGALERAVAAYEAALTVRTREVDPAGWAATQNNLGLALVSLGERGQASALERAVAAYEAALTVMTREADPAGWAVIQNNIGLALMRLGERGQAGALERALAAYEAALTVRTREVDPAGWAATQNNLGNALLRLGARGQAGALERAVAAYEAALTVRTREAYPAGWADTTYSLAFAYRAMGRYGDARAAAQGALEEYEQVGNSYWANEARAFLAGLPE